VRRKKER